MHEPTARQRRVLDFIIRNTEEKGCPPTIREIGEEFGFRSTGTVRDYLRALVAKGLIRWERRRARGFVPTERSRGIPILGRVAAGVPLLAEENVEGHFDLRSGVPVFHNKMFALRVMGDSMVGAGILDGDLVLVRQQVTARSGEIVVARQGEEATVKRLRLERRRGFLVPANPRYRPIPADEHTRIVGKVTALWRSL